MWTFFLFIPALIPFYESYEYNGRATGRHPFDKGVRFGYQNPIRVAPTLPPLFEAISTDDYQQGYDVYPGITERPSPSLPISPGSLK